MSALCERFGISRQTGYVWLKRFAAGEAVEDRSRRPHGAYPASLWPAHGHLYRQRQSVGTGVPNQWTRLRVWLLKLGSDLIHARPCHPQGRGKNERFHRSLEAEVLNFAALSGQPQAQRAFDRWREIYNHHRPHEAIGMAVPASRYSPHHDRFRNASRSPSTTASRLSGPFARPRATSSSRLRHGASPGVRGQMPGHPPP
ncbi:hypothetical protein RHI9324_04151 [Rhizobium sp. CECT 9324]|nr:hypothetical protein RHI9324_04151 [Rhizobium sp. CECT 9324]